MRAVVSTLSKSVFDPHDLKAMSTAFDDVCKEFGLRRDDPVCELIASRIISLAALSAECSPANLRDCVLEESGMLSRKRTA
jgi:hypothetical protein